MDIIHICKNDPRYPALLKKLPGTHVPESITAIGNLKILQQKKLAFFCSVKCPGNLILQAYDLAQALRDAGVTVIGGFHSPMEKECLTILLRGSQPVIVCPARNIEKMRLPKEFQEPLAENRLLILSPFGKKHHRVTIETSNIRNKFVAALANALFIAYAAPDSKTLKFCKDILSIGKPFFTLESDDNPDLIELGVKPIQKADDLKL